MKKLTGKELEQGMSCIELAAKAADKSKCKKLIKNWDYKRLTPIFSPE